MKHIVFAAISCLTLCACEPPKPKHPEANKNNPTSNKQSNSRLLQAAVDTAPGRKEDALKLDSGRDATQEQNIVDDKAKQRLDDQRLQDSRTIERRADERRLEDNRVQNNKADADRFQRNADAARKTTDQLNRNK